MATSVGEGLGSPAIEQDPSVAQLQAAQVGAQQALAVALPAAGFVASINLLSGLITFKNGANISITNDGVSQFTFSVAGLGGAATAKTNIAAVPPSTANDESEGYNYFSEWIVDVVPRELWVCLNPATMAADWQKVN